MLSNVRIVECVARNLVYRRNIIVGNRVGINYFNCTIICFVLRRWRGRHCQHLLFIWLFTEVCIYVLYICLRRDVYLHGFFILRNTISCSWLTENICVLEDKDKTTSDTYLLRPAYPAISHSKLFLQLKLIIWTAQNVEMIELIVMPLGDGYIDPRCSDNSLLCQTYFFFDNALTKLSRSVTNIRVSELNHHWFRLQFPGLFGTKPWPEPMLTYWHWKP